MQPSPIGEEKKRLGLSDLLSVAEQVQTFAMARKTGLMEVSEGERHGAIYFTEGEVVDAYFEDMRGPEAAITLINLNHTNTSFVPEVFSAYRTIAENHLDLLLAAAAAKPMHTEPYQGPATVKLKDAPALNKNVPVLKLNLQGVEHLIQLNKSPMTIGRGDENDIVIKEPSISRFHAQLVVLDGAVLLRDLDSSNGIYVSNHRVRDVMLHSKEALFIGGVPAQLIFEGFAEVDPDQGIPELTREPLAPPHRQRVVIDKAPLPAKNLQPTRPIPAAVAPVAGRLLRNLPPLRVRADQEGAVPEAPRQAIAEERTKIVRLSEAQLNGWFRAGPTPYPSGADQYRNQPHLVIGTGTVTRVVPITKNITTIGRDPDNDIPVEAEEISRFHARLEITPAGAALVDLGSANGTYLSGHKVDAGWLGAHDRFLLGGYPFTFVNVGGFTESPDAATSDNVRSSSIMA